MTTLKSLSGEKMNYIIRKNLLITLATLALGTATSAYAAVLKEPIRTSAGLQWLIVCGNGNASTFSGSYENAVGFAATFCSGAIKASDLPKNVKLGLPNNISAAQRAEAVKFGWDVRTTQTR